MSTPSPGRAAEARRMILPGDPALPLVLAEPAGAPRGTVVLIHGRNGAPDQPQIAQVAAAYLDRGWRVVRPELPHSAALPGSGDPAALTLAGHVAAACRALDHARTAWPDVPLALAGHSIGGYAVGRLAATPGLAHLLAVSPVLSGPRLLAARRAMGPQAMAELEAEAPLYRQELDRADAAPVLATSAAPLAVVTGACDGLVTPAHARAFGAAAPGLVFFGSIPGQHHCPEGPDCAAMLAAALIAVGA
ncbi:alpha/beta hydrolase [Marinibacterium sp. SX1]|uniref:alpha/beta hydrolase n=1 Tax=Marinibacterium sp. SX1 TaxID=3388424 RepID=UPI003D176B76